AGIYAALFDHLHVVPPSLTRQAPWAVVLIGMGTLLRLLSDTFGSVLQTRGRIARDNFLLAASDAFWAITTLALLHRPGLLIASITYAGAGMLLVAARALAVSQLRPTPWPPQMILANWQTAKRLMSFGALVLLSQLAEYFYAPTDYI